MSTFYACVFFTLLNDESNLKRRVFQYFIFEERIEAGLHAFIAEELPEVK